jgi:hypothetical protein
MLRIKDVFIINSRLVLIELHFYWPNNNKQRFDKRCSKSLELKLQHMTKILTRVTGDIQKKLTIFI